MTPGKILTGVRLIHEYVVVMAVISCKTRAHNNFNDILSILPMSKLDTTMRTMLSRCL